MGLTPRRGTTSPRKRGAPEKTESACARRSPRPVGATGGAGLCVMKTQRAHARGRTHENRKRDWVIETARETLDRHLAEQRATRFAGFATFGRAGFHRLATRHGLRLHGRGGGHRVLRRTPSGQAAGCQSRDGQHRAQQPHSSNTRKVRMNRMGGKYSLKRSLNNRCIRGQRAFFHKPRIRFQDLFKQFLDRRCFRVC